VRAEAQQAEHRRARGHGPARAHPGGQPPGQRRGDRERHDEDRHLKAGGDRDVPADLMEVRAEEDDHPDEGEEDDQGGYVGGGERGPWNSEMSTTGAAALRSHAASAPALTANSARTGVDVQPSGFPSFRANTIAAMLAQPRTVPAQSSRPTADACRAGPDDRHRHANHGGRDHGQELRPGRHHDRQPADLV
jgi:hypothetical protein